MPTLLVVFSSVLERALMYTPASAPLCRPSLVSQQLATPPVPFSVVTWSPLRPWRFPRFCLVYRHFSCAGHSRPSFRSGSYS
jgi:hypothetical protein